MGRTLRQARNGLVRQARLVARRPRNVLVRRCLALSVIRKILQWLGARASHEIVVSLCGDDLGRMKFLERLYPLAAIHTGFLVPPSKNGTLGKVEIGRSLSEGSKALRLLVQLISHRIKEFRLRARRDQLDLAVQR